MPDSLKIRTNNVPREVLHWHDLTDAERKDFDYRTEEDGAMFVRYRGTTYDLSDFMRWQTEEPEFRNWDGYHTESYFSGVLARFVDDGGRVVMGTYLS